MSAQEVGACLLVGLAAAYLLRRLLRRRKGGTCCGEEACPAAKALLDRLPADSPRGIHPKTR